MVILRYGGAVLISERLLPSYLHQKRHIWPALGGEYRWQTSSDSENHLRVVMKSPFPVSASWLPIWGGFVGIFNGDRCIFNGFRLFSLLIVLFGPTSRKKPSFAPFYELDSVSP